MSTKFGKRAQRPPLSALDKAIYIVILVLCVFSALLLLVFTRVHRTAILFKDASVIACESPLFSLFCILLIFYVSMTLIIVLGTAMQKRLPIFGNKKFKPKYFQAVLTVYPFFSKDFSKNFIGGWSFPLFLKRRPTVFPKVIFMR